MRSVFVKGKDFDLNLGCDISLVCAVLEHPKAKFSDPITAKVMLTGKELKEFMIQNRVEKSTDGIVDDEMYELNGWDW